MDKAQQKEFIKTNNIKTAEDIQTALRDLIKDTMQEMMEAEHESDLGYVKH
jgi:putative transposase